MSARTAGLSRQILRLHGCRDRGHPPPRRLPSRAGARRGSEEEGEDREVDEPQVDAAHAESYAIPQGDITEIWNNPVFKRQFVAGYGVSSDVEPRVSPDEVKVLEKIRPLMANDLAEAEETLKSRDEGRFARRRSTSRSAASSSSRTRFPRRSPTTSAPSRSSRRSAARGATWASSTCARAATTTRSARSRA